MPSDFAAIDFGTSNSAIVLPSRTGGQLVELEPGFSTMPTAVFYRSDLPPHTPDDGLCVYGRAAVAAYVEGHEGRLMRSMKSILGSSLVEQSTDVGGGRGVPYLDIVAGYLRHLKRLAEAAQGAPLRRVVLGRPVHFVDDDPEADQRAEAALRRAAHQVGFAEVQFQYEPIAAALDHERSVQAEQLVLVADIGGGTSDFSLVRVAPGRGTRLERAGDILANHGVHIAGTDFDRRIELAAVLPLLGYGSFGPAVPGRAPREVPNSIYFDLATWHLINSCYVPSRVAEWRRMRDWFARPELHRRLMTVLQERLGHALAAAAERAKIEAAAGAQAQIDLDAVESGLEVTLPADRAAQAIEDDLQRIVAAAAHTVREAGLRPDAVDALYFTGGSTGLQALVQRIAAGFPQAQVVRGERFASVALGLGVYAQALWG